MSHVTVLYNDGRIEEEIVDFRGYTPVSENSRCIIPTHHDKMEQIREIVASIHRGDIPLLYDTTMKSSDEKAHRLRDLPLSEHLQSACVLFFTSGTSGNPIGVLKGSEHLVSECEAQIEWLQHYKIEQCLVTVPFFHIYGYLFGLAIPLSMGLDIVTKEDFLPQEILKLCQQKPTLCITNPVFIRSMIRLRDDIDLRDTLFICSSGPLESEEALKFEQKYSTRLVQLYGSSETGGIAIREGGESLWNPLNGVVIESDEGILSVRSRYLSRYVFDDEFRPLSNPFQTTDIIEKVGEQFKIVGRASELVKIGGKRLSMVEIETFLETMEGIEEALGFVEYHPSSLRGETLTLYLVGDSSKIDKTVLKKALHDQFGGIHIESKIIMVDALAKTALGKKIRHKVIT
ncbi:MAG: AMP-binding protein [Sulfuricurvum sp.]|uniref:AMP-binding protein n=1 Tax=Sulfuricurvum sp. TaxID=2025608 RepID=UPI00260C9D03|nr:AMP-binding protein [Sulfuricurvum sp.]MDD2829447.1 AMP-binding protein [Sulfuricurvum sp.]MDD4948470.1 AMP-binding protein [Sulfuricurvum sp.]